LHGEPPLDGADQLRLEQMLAENLRASFHIWERTQRGIFPKGTFELTAGPHLSGLLRPPLLPCLKPLRRSRSPR
jgi:hypothetical protein